MDWHFKPVIQAKNVRGAQTVCWEVGYLSSGTKHYLRMLPCTFYRWQHFFTVEPNSGGQISLIEDPRQCMTVEYPFIVPKPCDETRMDQTWFPVHSTNKALRVASQSWEKVMEQKTEGDDSRSPSALINTILHDLPIFKTSAGFSFDDCIIVCDTINTISGIYGSIAVFS